MAALNYSSEAKHANRSIMVEKQMLPPELIEKIYKMYMGWDEVHEELLVKIRSLDAAPFCDILERKTKIIFCRICGDCGDFEKIGLCDECIKIGEKHYFHPLEWPDPNDEYYETYVKYL